MPKFIDIHTHNQTTEENTLKIINAPQVHGSFGQASGLFSLGLHPWYLDKNTFENDFQTLEQSSKNQNIIMIGECGLDRNIDVNFEFQKEVFIRQIQLAEHLQKPVIIHCVRAFPDIISIKKKIQPSVPMIIHGFNNNLQIYQQLIEHQFYISLGSALLNPNSNASKVIKMIPKEKLFLETDDKNCTISSIFALASAYSNAPIEILQEIIINNFNRIFSNQNLET
ncbi:TatD DNase family protein [Arcicella aurantiaca]|uniref:TatD DNase family protein n=1 Tax=Arcicella aurantiaca TaxID=591202 RepID=A0A316EBU3_9BACT|nr:TatD family hydrolase [Arcicella aurantiaca]PWK26243.1 TatD DNase family protein [Arcicella aurantiaca]